MAQGDLKGTLTASLNSIQNPTNLSGSVSVSVGDLVFGTISQQTNLTASGTVTDNLGNTYAYVNAGTDAGTVTIRSFWARVTVAGTLTQVSVPATASTNDASAVADVIEGPFLASPLDANPANTSDGTTPFTCPATGTLAQASEVVMAAIAVGSNQTVAATSPSVLTGTVARNNASVGQSRRVVSATTSVTPEFTGTTATASQVTASFKLDSTQTLTPGLFTNSPSFFAPLFTLFLDPSLFTNTNTLFDPTVLSVNIVTPDLFSNDNTFFSPTLVPGPVTVSPSLFTNTPTFPVPTLLPENTISPGLFENNNLFFAPTVDASAAQDINPSLFTNPNTIYDPVVLAEYDLSPDVLVNTQTFFAPTITTEVTINPGLFTNSSAFFPPTVQREGDIATGADYMIGLRRRRR